MSLSACLALAGFIVFALASSISAAQDDQARFSLFVRPSKGPFDNLFKPPVQFQAPAQPPKFNVQRYVVRPPSTQKPKVVCGMLVVPADPKHDPEFVKPVPEGNFSLRVVPPPVCND